MIIEVPNKVSSFAGQLDGSRMDLEAGEISFVYECRSTLNDILCIDSFDFPIHN